MFGHIAEQLGSHESCPFLVMKKMQVARFLPSQTPSTSLRMQHTYNKVFKECQFNNA